MTEINKVLSISTANIPRPENDKLDLNGIRTSETEYGWVVFLGEPDKDIKVAPDWFLPILNLALIHNCSMVDIDTDNPEDETLPIYSW